MSPTRKKTAKKNKAAASGAKKKTRAKASPKPSTAKAKASPKKAAAKKAARPKKAAAKKAARPKKAAAKKTASAKKAVAKKAAAPRTVAEAKQAVKPSAPVETAQKPVSAPAGAQPVEAAKISRAPKKRVPRGKPIPLSEVPHPKYGLKFECFQCQAKFYDLSKPDPICPKCGTDQRERPQATGKLPPLKPVKRVKRPMAPLLDDEEEAPSDAPSFEGVPPTPGGEDMFDDAVAVSVDDDEIFDAEDDKTTAQPVVTDEPENT